MFETIFVCSPYHGDVTKNTENVKDYCRWISYDFKLPIAPHLYFTQFLNEDTDRFKGMLMGKHLMQYCDEIWIYCNELTEGMIEEIEEAKKLKLKMAFFNEKREEINHANYLIHTEIGPAYRRIIADYYGDSYYLTGCGECIKRKDSAEERVISKPKSVRNSTGFRKLWREIINH